MHRLGNIDFEVLAAGAGRVLVRVTGSMMGVETQAGPEDLLKVSRYLAVEAEKFVGPKQENGIDHALIDRIVTAGVRVLSKKNHPDRGGSHEDMVKLNQAAELIREKVARR